MTLHNTFFTYLMGAACGIFAPYKLWNLPRYPVIGGASLLALSLFFASIRLFSTNPDDALGVSQISFCSTFVTVCSHAICLIAYARHWEIVTKFVEKETIRANISSRCYIFLFIFLGKVTLTIIYSLTLFIPSNPEDDKPIVVHIIWQFLEHAHVCSTPHTFCSLLKFFSTVIDRHTDFLRNHPIEALVIRSINRQREILKLSQATADAFGLHNLFSTINSFVQAITKIYESVAVFEETRGMLTLAANFLLSTLQLGLVLAVCHECQKLNRKVNMYNLELFRLMQSNNELCKNEKLQLFVTMKQRVNFTACGFFNLGYPLVTSIMATTTTYLVILLQFREPSKQ